ncbi:MAG: membrane protein insertase YidC, partial [Saprospiraceae bacterium]
NQIIGFLLILMVMLGWSELYVKPKMEAESIVKKAQDSLTRLQANKQESPVLSDTSSKSAFVSIKPDSGIQTVKEIKTFYLKNDLTEIAISSHGGKIISAKLNKYSKIHLDSSKNEIKTDLFLLTDTKNKFEYLLKTSTGDINTADLDFNVIENSDTKLVLKASIPTGGSFTQEYALDSKDYKLFYAISSEGMNLKDDIKLYWEDHLDKLERNTTYELSNSSLYYKELVENAKYCSCTSSDLKEDKKQVQWFANSNQFFNSALVPKTPFSSGTFETVMEAPNSNNLKILKSSVTFPSTAINNNRFEMQMYNGPNDFDRLKAFNVNLEDVISYGWSIFGTINKYFIRPLFAFLSNFISSKGIIILLMTLIVKLLVFPLAYKMLQSQAKMMALKPEIEKVKAKHKDDMQQQQVETMKMYNEFGVNPLGGCFPLLLQTPIWIALYRFFPATVNFRQESFLWASDLTSYDEFLRLPFSIPLFGETLSLFAFLWVVSTIIFTYYNSKSTDFSANPAMLYMQYIMPFFFWFMFNKTAAGLTCYMFFSNLLNIGQTVLGRSILFDTEKIRASLELNKAKPKKQGGFQQKIADMMKERQKIEQEKLKNSKKK